MAKETDQDPRSIHGRVTKLIEFGLIQRFPVVHGGMSTHLIVYKKFIKENREAANPRNSVGVDLGELRREIVRLVKEGEEGKPGIRQHDDLKRQLGFDTTSRSHITFSECVRRLEAQGYVKRVISQPAGKAERFRCIKFLKDFEIDKHDPDESDDEDLSAVDFMDEVNSGGDSEVAGSLASGTSETINGKGSASGSRARSLAEMGATEIKEEELDNSELMHRSQSNGDVLLSLHFPFEVQVTSLIEMQGVNGLPAMDMGRRLVGKHYSRIFSRLLGIMVDKNPAKKKEQPENLGYLDLLRGTDSDGRVKYYRYYTQNTYRQFRGLERDPKWGEFSKDEVRGCHKNLASLNESNASQIPGVMEVRREGDVLIPLFHGERGRNMVDAPLVLGGGVPRSSVAGNGSKSKNPVPGRKRGRPRKRPLSDDEDANAKTAKKRGKKKKSIANDDDGDDGDSNVAQVDQQHVHAPETIPQLQPDALLADTTNAPLLAPSSDSLSQPAVDIREDPLLTASGTAEPAQSGIESTKHAAGPEAAPSTASQNNDESKQLSEQAKIALATPRYKRPAKKDNLYYASEGSLALASNKRDAQLMEFLDHLGGASDYGTAFVRNFNNYINEKTDTDRRTIKRQVERLTLEEKVRTITVVFPNANGKRIAKTILMKKELDDDSEVVKNVKKDLELLVKTPRVPTFTPTKKIEVEENDVGFAFNEVHEMFVRGSARKSRKSGGTGNAAAAQRLAQADKKRAQNARKSTKRDNQEMSDDGDRSINQNRKRGNKAAKGESGAIGEGDGEGERNVETPVKRSRKSSNKKSSGKNRDEDETQMSTPTPSTFMDDFSARRRKVSKPKTRTPAKIDPVTGKHIRHRQTKYDDVDSDFFYRVVVVVRSLFPNPSGMVSWDKVTEAFHIYSGDMEDRMPDVAKSKWPKIRDRFGGRAELRKAGKRFEKIFLEAYKAGIFEIVKSSSEWDIAAYALYWRDHDIDLQEATVPWLANSREKVERDFVLERESQQDMIEQVYSAPSMVKTDEILTNHCYSFPKYGTQSKKKANAETGLEKAQKAIKSIIATKSEDYDIATSTSYLEQLGQETCKDAIQQLEKDKSILYGPKDRNNMGPGRNYNFTDRFMQALQTKYSDSILEDASNFEIDLMNAANQQKGLIMSRAAPDSSMVCALELTCYQLIHLVRVNGEHLTSIFGDGYRSRKLDKDQLDCDIVWRNNSKTKKIDSIERPEVPVPLSAQPMGNTWTAVNGELNNEIWRSIVKTVLWLVVLRPGISADALQIKLKIALTYDEVESVLAWLVERQVLEKLDCNGYLPRIRWYSHVF